jgi:hypothetical protein
MKAWNVLRNCRRKRDCVWYASGACWDAAGCAPSVRTGWPTDLGWPAWSSAPARCARCPGALCAACGGALSPLREGFVEGCWWPAARPSRALASSGAAGRSWCDRQRSPRDGWRAGWGCGPGGGSNRLCGTRRGGWCTPLPDWSACCCCASPDGYRSRSPGSSGTRWSGWAGCWPGGGVTAWPIPTTPGSSAKPTSSTDPAEPGSRWWPGAGPRPGAASLPPWSSWPVAGAVVARRHVRHRRGGRCGGGPGRGAGLGRPGGAPTA